MHSFVCEKCFLVQLPEHVTAQEIFEEYAYFSSYSDSWLAHAKRYVIDISKRLRLGPESLAIEIASNDGYLLQYFKELNIPVLGIEPAKKRSSGRHRQGYPLCDGIFRLRHGGEVSQGRKKG